MSNRISAPSLIYGLRSKISPCRLSSAGDTRQGGLKAPKREAPVWGLLTKNQGVHRADQSLADALSVTLSHHHFDIKHKILSVIANFSVTAAVQPCQEAGFFLG